MAPSQHPRSTRGDGRWSNAGAGDWTSGFYPGGLWLMHEKTGDPAWRTRAQAQTADLEGQKSNTRDHDVGFRILSSYGHGLRLTGQPAYKDVILAAAVPRHALQRGRRLHALRVPRDLEVPRHRRQHDEPRAAPPSTSCAPSRRARTSPKAARARASCCTGVGSKPAGSEVDVSLIYGDYYFLEALLRYRRGIPQPADDTRLPGSSAGRESSRTSGNDFGKRSVSPGNGTRVRKNRARAWRPGPLFEGTTTCRRAGQALEPFAGHGLHEDRVRPRIPADDAVELLD